MSNETPWYYPPGWDRERMLNADDEESETLTPEQLDTFRQGLRVELGKTGMEEFQMESFKRWKQRSQPPTLPGDHESRNTKGTGVSGRSGDSWCFARHPPRTRHAGR